VALSSQADAISIAGRQDAAVVPSPSVGPSQASTVPLPQNLSPSARPSFCLNPHALIVEGIDLDFDRVIAHGAKADAPEVKDEKIDIKTSSILIPDNTDGKALIDALNRTRFCTSRQFNAKDPNDVSRAGKLASGRRTQEEASNIRIPGTYVPTAHLQALFFLRVLLPALALVCF
jgi:hypothetical protein